MPDLELISKSQCFPRWRFKTEQSVLQESVQKNLFQSLLRTECQTSIFSNSDNASQDGDLGAVGGAFADEKSNTQKSLFSEDPADEDNGPIDNINDSALLMFQTHYRDGGISKDNIFDYVYGVLHAPDLRATFPVALSRQFPRIPLAKDFYSFVSAGQKLSELHLGYESCPEYYLELKFTGSGTPAPEHFRLGTKPMQFGGKRGNQDKSVLNINMHIKLVGIPDKAHNYVVNGRTPLEWYIDRYKITTDKKSGIKNDPNKWFKNPPDIISAIRRIVHVSVETIRIVESLPNSLDEH